MELNFSKYQGTGNDFIMIDNRALDFPKNDTTLISRLCDRRFGIGSDGLILLESDKISDFGMVYFNSDGYQSTMCGNGGRCIVAFAKRLGIISDSASFTAIDGPHTATIDQDNSVALGMADVDSIDNHGSHIFLNTGSPHHVELVDDLKIFEVRNTGSKIRYGQYGVAGSNVNFVEQKSADNFSVRTYERGVEDETLSCGTGVTAVAIAMHSIGKTNAQTITLDTQGGQLLVSFSKSGDHYTNVKLIGPATFVFSGQITI